MKDYPDLKIEAILEQELYTSPPLMWVIVAKLTGTKQDITRVFKLTKDIASTAELKHLRRVRYTDSGDIECIVCSPDINNYQIIQLDAKREFSHEEFLRSVEERFRPDNVFKDFRIALVPAKAPRTEHQLNSCQKLWPCKYAKSNYLNKCIEGTVFDQAERLAIKIIANELLQYIKSREISETSGAVIFRYAKVYGVGLSCRQTCQDNPTKHSAMLAIDSVANNAGSGHWKSRDQASERVLLELLQQQLDEQAELANHKIGSDFLPYLCTNYDVIVTEEPCMMCTMGLVQSRIRRLFYLDLTAIDRQSASNVCFPDQAIEKFLVHRDKYLNHRFEAWRLKFT